MPADKHSLVVVNPGHFHAALTLRMPHPRLNDEVHVYAEDGPDLERFLDIVQAFNERSEAPTRWALRVYRGTDYLERLLIERPGRLAVVAGRNDSKMTLIERLHAEGFFVLGDKPWIIGAQQLAALNRTAGRIPLAMDIMTERREVSIRLLRALLRREEVFGSFDVASASPALMLQSLHFLYKLVNGKPLVRPAWYFDTRVQGEGMIDVNTHLVDLALWMIGNDEPIDPDRDVELVGARQWPTEVPRDIFTRITGLDDFPQVLRAEVVNDALGYLCNAALDWRLCGVGVRAEALWELAIPPGGGDTHAIVARGTQATLVVKLDASTGFRSQLTVHPLALNGGYAERLSAALASLQPHFPDVRAESAGKGFRVAIPDALRSTHEEHFAKVLDEFIGYADGGRWPENLGPDLLVKYTLLERACEMSHRGK